MLEIYLIAEEDIVSRTKNLHEDVIVYDLDADVSI